jgi:23S rRNA (uracil1939-C5)-methyltransferase
MVAIYQAKKKPAGNQYADLNIDRWDHEAQGISHLQGKICFTEGALPGELVRVRLTEQKKDFQRAVVQKVLTPVPGRRVAPCQYAGSCGGCQLQHVQPASALAFKQQAVDALLRHQLKRVELPWQPAITSAETGYRRRARLGVWYDKKSHSYQVGFRKAASKEILDVATCAVLTPALQPALPVLRNVLPQLSQGQAITHVELLDADGQAYLVVRHVKPLPSGDMALLCNAWPEAIWFGEPESGQYRAWQTGTAVPAYQLGHLSLQFQPTDFIQVNAAVNQQMVAQALSWLMPKNTEQVLDLYCGIGNFSLPLAAAGAKVTAVEGIAEMVQRAHQNAAANQLIQTEFVRADLHLPWPDEPWAQRRYDKVLLDPARAGAEVCVSELAKRQPAQILYVSCNPATFARDAKILLAKRYQLTKIGVMDMFPNTSHLELMALFELTRQ